MTPQTEQLTLRRVFAAPREKLFAAWTTPDLLKKWMGRPQFTGLLAEVDLAVGGRYRLEVISDDGQRLYIVGQYQEIAPPEKLVYTWAFEGAPDEGSPSLVTVEFYDLGDSTEVVLRHQRVVDVPTREMYEYGWTTCFARLETLLA